MHRLFTKLVDLVPLLADYFSDVVVLILFVVVMVNVVKHVLVHLFFMKLTITNC